MQSKIKKVCLVLWNEGIGGIEKTLPVFPKYIKDRKFLLFILRIKSNAIDVFKKSEFPEKYYGSNNNIKLYFKFFKFCLYNKKTIFHLFNAGPIILIILRLARCENVIYHIRGTKYWKNKYQKFRNKFFWKIVIYPKINFIANSEFSKRVFLKSISKIPYIKVIYNPFSINIPRLSKPKNKRLRIFYLGRLVPGKNLFNWIEVAKVIKMNFPLAEFHIYGDGILKEKLCEFSKTLSLENSIIFHGYVIDTNIVYSNNDLLIFLSEYESFGNVVVESILAGLPVIASKIPSIQEIFRDYPEFIVGTNLNIFDEILLRIRSIDKLKQLALIAQKDFQNKFNINNFIIQLNEIYNNFHD